MATKDQKEIAKSIRKYAHEISTIEERMGETAREHNFRTPLENLLNELNPVKDVFVTQEQSQKGGAPDFTAGTTYGEKVGYIECKNIGHNLDNYLVTAQERSGQIARYSQQTPNILLTDYVRFCLLTNTERDKEMFIAKEVTLNRLKPSADEMMRLEDIVNQFFNARAQTITSSEELADKLARPCRDLRRELTKLLPKEQGELTRFRSAFEGVLSAKIDDNKLADVLAQTIIYGLFSAKLHNPAATIRISDADTQLPKSFGVISEILKFLRDLRVREVDSVIERATDIVNNIGTDVIIKSMAYNSPTADEVDDPYIYFYETFLSKYDQKMRESRGVYYTPAPVVKFIVRAIDDVLKANFGYSGLDDKRVTLLDFAAGTGTFLLEVIRKMFEGHGKQWPNKFGLPHILKHIHGFEYLIAPYTLAHLKLNQFLRDNGVNLPENERLSIYLTNTLEQATSSQGAMDVLLPKLSAENDSAAEIKQQEILVVTGNPPYSASSQNNGKWITDLLRGEVEGVKKYESYFEVDGKNLNERKQWLNDDYVKFIRFAQYKMELYEQGIVAIITNHAFLDNPTFRGMRQSLLNTFDKLYFLDLHGNTRKGETAGEDENVFDIQQGVSISIFIKQPNTKKGVYHADLYGLRRDKKYNYCHEKKLSDIKWKELEPIKPYYFFIPRNTVNEAEYSKFKPLNDIFTINSSGILTSHDEVAIADDEFTLEERFIDFAKPDWRALNLDFRAKGEWDLESAHIEIRKLSNITQYIEKISYRVFDSQWCFYHPAITWRMRHKKLRHLLWGDNMALISVRQFPEKTKFNHVFITSEIADVHIVGSCSYVYPLYLYDERGTQQTENLKPEFRAWIDARYGKEYEPKQILACIYATLHSPKYREKYNGFLKYDFPRVPFPADKAEFERLSEIGAQLMDAHLLKNPAARGLEFDGEGDGTIQRVRYVPGEKEKDAGRVYINKDVYLTGITPEVYEFQIGGYQPLDKYLKSRKGRELTRDEEETLIKAATAIARTIELQGEIDDEAPK